MLITSHAVIGMSMYASSCTSLARHELGVACIATYVDKLKYILKALIISFSSSPAPLSS